MENKQTISIIGNNAFNSNISDGGRIKIRLFKNLIENYGYKVNMIDLSNWIFHLPTLLSKIKKSLKNNERIIIMGGPKGCRVVLSLISHLKKESTSKLVFCALGIGTIDKVVKNLSESQIDNFIHCKNFYNKSDNKFKKYLSEAEYVIVENNALKKCYENFYNLNNVCVLPNFRDASVNESDKVIKTDDSGTLKVLYYSRVCENKGIFDIVNAVLHIFISLSRMIYKSPLYIITEGFYQTSN